VLHEIAEIISPEAFFPEVSHDPLCRLKRSAELLRHEKMHAAWLPLLMLHDVNRRIQTTACGSGKLQLKGVLLFGPPPAFFILLPGRCHDRLIRATGVWSLAFIVQQYSEQARDCARHLGISSRKSLDVAAGLAQLLACLAPVPAKPP
jgi:hypothetical protein